MTAQKIRCICSSFEFGTYGPDGSAESSSSYTTGCSQPTTHMFARGHDAKLVSFLVRAELMGEEISRTRGGVKRTFAGAVSAARTVSDALAVKALEILQAREAKIARKVAREHGQAARQAARQAAPKPTTREARIKVGRWTYDASIDSRTGWATYTKKAGQTVSIASTDYKEV